MASNWKSLLVSQLCKNVELNGPSSAYVSLATMGREGPSNRTVVARGFAGEHHKEELGWESDLLVITCDKRSGKVKEIEANPLCEINWWMGGTLEQFRLHGGLLMVGSEQRDTIAPQHVVRKTVNLGAVAPAHIGNQAFLKRQGQQTEFDWEAERLRQWFLMSDTLRATFCDNGSDKAIEPLVIDGMDDRGHFTSKRHQDLLERGYKNFMLLLFKATWVDHLLLETGEQRRWNV